MVKIEILSRKKYNLALTQKKWSISATQVKRKIDIIRKVPISISIEGKDVW